LWVASFAHYPAVCPMHQVSRSAHWMNCSKHWAPRPHIPQQLRRQDTRDDCRCLVHKKSVGCCQNMRKLVFRLKRQQCYVLKLSRSDLRRDPTSLRTIANEEKPNVPILSQQPGRGNDI